jgi:hypothetical protein
MKNVLFNIKSVITGSSKAVAGAGSGAGANFLKVRAGAGVETNSFSSATLLFIIHIFALLKL